MQQLGVWQYVINTIFQLCLSVMARVLGSPPESPGFHETLTLTISSVWFSTIIGASMFSQETSAGFLWHLWRNSHLKRPIFVGTIQLCPGQLSGQTGCRSRFRNIHQHSGFVALLMATHLHYLRTSSCPFVSYFCHPMILNLRVFFKWSFPNGFPLFFQLFSRT